MARSLGLQHLSTPAVLRDLDEGAGSVRPYIQGEALATLDQQETDLAYSNREDLEDLALYDYLLQYLDRREENLIWTKKENTGQIKAIDHSMTFFHESFAANSEMKGPRLAIAYDNTTARPTLEKTPLPDRLIQKLESFIQNEETVRTELKNYLSNQEVDWVLKRVHEAFERKIFL